jgi:hypothetical protein
VPSVVKIKLTTENTEIHGEKPIAETVSIEKQIDELVYKLYGLTEEKIRIINKP